MNQSTRLARRVEFLEAERARLERLLASVLLVAVRGTSVSPATLLEVIAEVEGLDLTKAATKRRRISDAELLELLRPIPGERTVECAA